jgi:hypothetical protein
MATAPTTTSGSMVLSLANGSYTNADGMAGSAGFGMQAFGVQTAPAPSVANTYDQFNITYSNSQIAALSNGMVISSHTRRP